MTSLHAFSAHALSATSPIKVLPPSLTRLAQGRVANPIVFVELTARANDVTSQSDELAAFSALPFSSLTLPRVVRTETSYLFSTRPWIGAPTDTLRANQRARPRVITGGRVSLRVPVEAASSRRGQRTIGDVVLANADGGLDFLLTDNTLQGGSIKAWIAEPQDGASDWALVYEATIKRVDATRKEIRIGISTIADQLKRPFQLNRYTGSGGLAGDDAVAGRYKPYAYGDIFGADPVLMSTPHRIYQVHDGSIQSIDAVYEGGLPFTFTADYPDFDTLANATLAVGEYATCLARGLFRIGTTLDGLVHPLRVTFKGANGDAGYVSSTGDILYRIARAHAFIPAIQLDIDTFNALPRQTVGFYANGATELTCEAVFDQLLSGVFGTYGVGLSGKISIQRITPATSTSDLSVRGSQLLDLSVEERPFEARTKQPFTYAKTWAPVTNEQVFAGADSSLVARLTSQHLTGEANQDSTAVIPQLAQPTLTTFFAEEEPAENIALDTLAFSGRDVVPLNVALGRLGLLAQIGGVISVEDARFAEDFRGAIYDVQFDLGATISTEVTALG